MVQLKGNKVKLGSSPQTEAKNQTLNHPQARDPTSTFKILPRHLNRWNSVLGTRSTKRWKFAWNRSRKSASILLAATKSQVSIRTFSKSKLTLSTLPSTRSRMSAQGTKCCSRTRLKNWWTEFHQSTTQLVMTTCRKSTPIRKIRSSTGQ